VVLLKDLARDMPFDRHFPRGEGCAAIVRWCNPMKRQEYGNRVFVFHADVQSGWLMDRQ
jgi:hypothetical protein